MESNNRINSIGTTSLGNKRKQAPKTDIKGIGKEYETLDHLFQNKSIDSDTNEKIELNRVSFNGGARSGNFFTHKEERGMIDGANDDDDGNNAGKKKQRKQGFQTKSPIPREVSHNSSSNADIRMKPQLLKGTGKMLNGKLVSANGIVNPVLKARLQHEQLKSMNAANANLKSELLLSTSAGYIEADENEKTYDLKQSDIVGEVDLQSKAKSFALDLRPNGPYHINFTKSGNHLLLAGQKGHYSIIRWKDGVKSVENHINEPIRDACFLHNEKMFALAQKKYTYIYNSKGVQLHCLKEHYDPRNIEFLPYHYLLVSNTFSQTIIYEDVSIGKVVAKLKTKSNSSTMCKNKSNGIIHTGSINGIIELWQPTSPEAIAKVYAHRGAITGLAATLSGNYMVSTSADAMVKVFDLRNTYNELRSYKLNKPATSLALSDTNMLAVSSYKSTILWKNPFDESITEPYLIHQNVMNLPATSLEFCPYEDILGVGSEYGYSSWLIPGSGQANFDSLEADPYSNKTQRDNLEVRSLLEKIPYDMISLNSDIIGAVVQGSENTEEDKHKRSSEKHVKPEPDFSRIDAIDEKKREERKQRDAEILNPTVVRDALSRFKK